jgi:hypothetical protein
MVITSANSINEFSSPLDIDEIHLEGSTISTNSPNTTLAFKPEGSLKIGDLSASSYLKLHRDSPGEWIRFSDGNSDFGFFSWDGSPENEVIAEIGSLCTDTSVGDLYIKKADPGGSTGWFLSGGNKGNISQIVESFTEQVFNVSNPIPSASVPQITDGDEILSLQVTPHSATNVIHIEWVILYSYDTNFDYASVLFREGTSDAKSVSWTNHLNSSGGFEVFVGEFYEVSGTTSPITYSIRCGAPSGATPMQVNSALYGGKTRSTLRIRESIG